MEDDLEVIERTLEVRLPDELRQHYLRYNGGKPNRALWIFPDGEWDDIEIRDFIPMRYIDKFGDDPSYTAEGRAREGWAEKRLSSDLFPIAFDWGGNWFCVNHKNGGVYYFVRDVWSDNISPERNLQINTRFVARSLLEFVEGLVLSEDG